MIDINASLFYTYYQPSTCDLRVYLRSHSTPESPPSPYLEVLFRLGKRHEQKHLSTFSSYADLGPGEIDDRFQRTTKEVNGQTAVIYQGVLRAEYAFVGQRCMITGVPDFMILESGGYIIRESKLARRINSDDHPEILFQLGLYGWLFEKVFGGRPLRLEVHDGSGSIVVVPSLGEAPLAVLHQIVELIVRDEDFYSPVGWTKCMACGFREHCWQRAEATKDISLISAIDQSAAMALREAGARTIAEVLRFDETTLANTKKRRGGSLIRIGLKAKRILKEAQAMASQKHLIEDLPAIPSHDHYVMFDVEGLPPHLDELQKVYLWGIKVFGRSLGTYKFGLTDFGEEGDNVGWEEFLAEARAVFDAYGNVPFVHWSPYERTSLHLYMGRWGDRDGTAARVIENLLDLLPITQKSVVLPLPSYSLKAVEQYIGFKRTQDEYGGDWSMAKYIEATEIVDRTTRDQVMREILTYNEEDLDATWAVLGWLRGLRRVGVAQP